AAFTFSFNGPFDRLDWVFYWGDAIAMALLPPLLLHFAVVFPPRRVAEKQEHAPGGIAARRHRLVPLIYVPALLLAIGRVAAIVRYRLRDIEVIVKRGLAYTAFLAASVALYAGMLELTSFLVGNDADDHNRIIALVTTIVVVLLAQPVKEAVQNALDRVFYRD